METCHPGSAARPLLAFDQGTLLLARVSSRMIERLFDGGIWFYDPRVAAFRTDAFRYVEVSSVLQARLEGGFEDQVPDFKPIAWQANRLHVLRPDQQAALDAWSVTRRGCLVMPTGTGKTEIALHAIVSCGQSVLIVAPVRDLMYQWHRRILERSGIDAGVLGDGIHRVSPVTVTTYDSAFLHMARIGRQFALIVFDECHHLPGEQRQDAARMCAAPWRLGLTATPERADGKHERLQELVGPIVYRQKLSEVRGKSLAEYDLQRISVHLSDEERRRYDSLSQTIRTYMQGRREKEAGFTWKQLCGESGSDPAARHVLRAFRQKEAIEDRAEEKLRILEDLFCLHVGEPCLIFTGTNAMAREISQRFLIPCLLSHCGKRERLDLLQGLETGQYPALVANRVLDEGVDLPDVKVAIILGGSASPRQAVQRLGRILRRSRYGRGTLYEIVTRQTRDEIRSRRRRSSDAYKR